MHAFAGRTARETAHLVTDLPVGIAGFTFVVAALATGASLAITLAGIPILAAALVLARHAAGYERARARRFLGVEIAAPAARESGSTFMTRLLSPLRDRANWRASAYFLLMLPAGTFTFSAAVAIWSTGAFLLTLPMWAWALPHNGPQVTDASWWSSARELAMSSVAGALVLMAAPFAIHALTHVDRRLLRLLGAR
jgi:hypothetical protein